MDQISNRQATVISDEDADERTIKKFVRSHLPERKVPQKIYFVASLPRSQTGKLQRHRLAQIVAQK